MLTTEKNRDYRNSHTAPQKGSGYKKSFEINKYRNFIWKWERDTLNKIVKKYLNKEAPRYLDFACGTGRILGFLTPSMGEATGVDVSESMLEQARADSKKYKILQADLTRENVLAGQYFDVITSFRFFLNAQPELRKEAIDVISSLLDTNGIFIFNIHMNHTSLFAKLMRVHRFIRRRPVDDFNTLSMSQMSKLLEKHNIKIVATFHLGILPIVNENTRIPISIISFFEAQFSKIKLFRYLARYIVVVCKKNR